jgi:hypothetical protein
MLKVVPVCGGGSDLRVEASTWGRAGLRLRRINFVFLAGGSEERDVSLLVVVSAVLMLGLSVVEGAASGEAERLREGDEGAKDVRAWTTSAMVEVGLGVAQRVRG